MNGCGDIFVDCFVRVLNMLDFPVFGKPARTTCMSAFFIPACPPLPDFFCLTTFDFNFLYRMVRFFRMFSEDLCFGTSFIMISRQAILCSSEVAS